MPRYDESVLHVNDPGLAAHHAGRTAAVGGSSSAAIGDQQESSRGAIRQWKAEAAGLPCAIDLADDGCWVVTIASATTSRREDLTAAIVEASGGLVSNAEAFKLAAAVKNASDGRPGYAEQPTVKPQRQTRAGR